MTKLKVGENTLNFLQNQITADFEHQKTPNNDENLQNAH